MSTTIRKVKVNYLALYFEYCYLISEHNKYIHNAKYNTKTLSKPYVPKALRTQLSTSTTTKALGHLCCHVCFTVHSSYKQQFSETVRLFNLL